MDRLLFPLAAALACGAAPAYAADGSRRTAAAAANAAEPIVITGQQLNMASDPPRPRPRPNTDVKDIPQALTTVTSQQIADQQLRSVGDLLLFVPGASYGGGEGNRDQIVLRGNSSTADFFVDGVRDDVQYFRDFYNIDRVEVLKGPNAMIFGRGGGGGIVNRVLKRPTLRRRAERSRLRRQLGRLPPHRRRRPAAQRTVGVRLNAMYEGGGSFRNHVDFIATESIRQRAIVSGDTRIDLSYEHFHDRRTADRGVPADGDEPIRGFTRTFFGDPDISFARADVDLATIAVEHDFGGGLTLRNRHDVRRLPQILSERVRQRLQRPRPAWSAKRLQQPQRPHEPVQPDRSRLGEPAGRHRPDTAVRLRAGPRAIAQQAQHRQLLSGDTTPIARSDGGRRTSSSLPTPTMPTIA